jgi:hypothetical protein
MEDAPFQLEGPDRDGFVWICSSEGREVWCHNLATVEQVREVFATFLVSIDRDENC